MGLLSTTWHLEEVTFLPDATDAISIKPNCDCMQVCTTTTGWMTNTSDEQRWWRDQHTQIPLHRRCDVARWPTKHGRHHRQHHRQHPQTHQHLYLHCSHHCPPQRQHYPRLFQHSPRPNDHRQMPAVHQQPNSPFNSTEFNLILAFIMRTVRHGS